MPEEKNSFCGCIAGLVLLLTFNGVLYGAQKLYHRSDLEKVEELKRQIARQMVQIEDAQNAVAPYDEALATLSDDQLELQDSLAVVTGENTDVLSRYAIHSRSRTRDGRFKLNLTATELNKEIDQIDRAATDVRHQKSVKEDRYREEVDAYNSLVSEHNKLVDKCQIWLLWPRPIMEASEWSEVLHDAMEGKGEKVREFVVKAHLEKILEEALEKGSEH